uniref:Uncharacterized protein n=1 Tax=Leersia perrieri TaxID=77586 RepID=A0A0D9VU51_9ORYZ
MPETFVILEDVVQHTLSNLHSIRNSILFWESINMGTDSQKVYYMILQRGPRAFVETTCQTLARHGRNGSPVQHLLNSLSDMIATKIGVLTRMQHYLASFIVEVYYEFDKLIGSHGSSDKLLYALFVLLNATFSKLEVALTNAGEV